MKTLLKFEADWCGPCQQIKPIVEAALEKQSEINLQVVNVDDEANHPLVQKHGVRAIPTLVLLNGDDDVIDTHRGALNLKEMESFIASTD